MVATFSWFVCDIAACYNEDKRQNWTREAELTIIRESCYPIHLPQESLCQTGHVVDAISCARHYSLLSFSFGSLESGNELFSLFRLPENKQVEMIKVFNESVAYCLWKTPLRKVNKERIHKITTQKNMKNKKCHNHNFSKFSDFFPDQIITNCQIHSVAPALTLLLQPSFLPIHQDWKVFNKFSLFTKERHLWDHSDLKHFLQHLMV